MGELTVLVCLVLVSSVGYVTSHDGLACGCSRKECKEVEGTTCNSSYKGEMSFFQKYLKQLCRCCRNCERDLHQTCGGVNGFCKKGLSCRTPAGTNLKICMQSLYYAKETSGATDGIRCLDRKRRYYIEPRQSWMSDCVIFNCTIVGTVQATPIQCNDEFCSIRRNANSPCCRYCSPKMSVHCEPTYFRVEIKKPILGYHAEDMSLADSTCKASENETHVIMTSAYTECGTKTIFLKKEVVYQNKVNAFKRNSVIVRKYKSWSVNCLFTRVRVLSRRIKVINFRSRLEEGFSLRFTTPQGGLLPIHRADDLVQSRHFVNGRVNVVVQAESAYGKKKFLVVDYCFLVTKAAVKPGVHSLIKRNCIANDGVEVMANNRGVLWFSFEPERFVTVSNVRDNTADLYCRARTCTSNDRTPQCTRGCRMMIPDA